MKAKVTFYLKSGHEITIKCDEYTFKSQEDGTVTEYELLGATESFAVCMDEIAAIRGTRK